MKIKHIKNTFFILCIIFLADFNYLSLAAINDQAKTKVVIDSDNDGLSDNEETLYGTNSRNPDTDSDGYSDGVEVKSGYNPLKAAPGDKIYIKQKTKSGTQETTSQSSLTNIFIGDFQQFIYSKKGQSLSIDDVRRFVDNELAANIVPTDISNMPSIEKSKLKIKSQSYLSLSESEKKKTIEEDAYKYLKQVVYLFISNAPTTIITTEDLDAFQQDFANHLTESFSAENASYFSDLGSRLEIFSQQLNELEIPETMVDLHIKFVRIINGALSLRNSNLVSGNSSNDPMGNIVALTKVNDLRIIFSNFLSNDLQNYLEQISTD